MPADNSMPADNTHIGNTCKSVQNLQNSSMMGLFTAMQGTMATLQTTVNMLQQKHNGDSPKIVSEYDQEIPQSQTADNRWHREEELLNHHETPGRPIKQSNQLSLPHQDDCNARMDTK